MEFSVFLKGLGSLCWEHTEDKRSLCAKPALGFLSWMFCPGDSAEGFTSANGSPSQKSFKHLDCVSEQLWDSQTLFILVQQQAVTKPRNQLKLLCDERWFLGGCLLTQCDFSCCLLTKPLQSGEGRGEPIWHGDVPIFIFHCKLSVEGLILIFLRLILKVKPYWINPLDHRWHYSERM